MNPLYPIYVPSKGRHQKDRALTIKALQRDRVPFRLVVQPAEARNYLPLVSEQDHLVVLPSDDFNLLKTRNWIRDHAERLGAAKHFQLDDNIIEFRRLWKGRRIPCHAGMALRVCEEISDRYENVGISGLNYQMFVPADTRAPFYLNCHVYSCSLINHAMECRWRLEYNDDTDICLQALTTGWCTILVSAFMANKLQTMILGGGNSDDLYRVNGAGDTTSGGMSDTMGRFSMARSLQRSWPGLVKLSRRFDRYQHWVDWEKFAKDPVLRLRPGVDLAELPAYDEYGMVLRAVKKIKSPAIKTLLEEWVP